MSLIVYIDLTLRGVFFLQIENFFCKDFLTFSLSLRWLSLLLLRMFRPVKCYPAHIIRFLVSKTHAGRYFLIK